MENEIRPKFTRESAIAKRLEQEPQLAWLSGIGGELPGAEWFVVGGAVRDLLLDRGDIKDFDLVVRHASLEDVSRVLEAKGKLELVGRDFGVLKFWPATVEGERVGGEAVDVAWPRTEKAGGSGGYRDFQVQADPELPLTSDLARRDFTMNALAWDLKQDCLIDPFDGHGDIKRRLVRCVGNPAERFQEDYSRVLRAMRFACQLGFEIEPATWEAIKRFAPRLDETRSVRTPDGKTMEERIVPPETVAKELIKAFRADPVRALELLETSGALFRLLPELTPMLTCVQSPDRHSEGDAWTHTKLTLAKLHGPEFAAWFPNEKPDVETCLAAIFHDVGKPAVADLKDGNFIFHGHEEEGSHRTRSAFERLKLASAGVEVDRVVWLVKNHLFPNQVRVDEVRRTTLAKYFLADRVAGRGLLHLAFADASASVPSGGSVDLTNLRRVQEALAELAPRLAPETSRPVRLLPTGEIMALTGLEEGPEIGLVLARLHEAQLQGLVTTPAEAKIFLLQLDK